jgi:DNA polymerase-3 subunit epsilon
MSKYTGLYQTKAACFQYKIKECDGACIGMVSTEEYNLRVSAFITNNSFENQNMVIVEKGRTVNERSAVLVENGVYKGYTFYDLNYQKISKF